MDDALQPAPLPEQPASDDDPIPEALGEFSEAVVNKFRDVDREIAVLKGQLDVVLKSMGVAGKADVVELPNWRKKSNAA